MKRFSWIIQVGPILFQVSLKVENLPVHDQRTKWYEKDLTWFDLTHPTMLMALTMEEGSHKNISFLKAGNGPQFTAIEKMGPWSHNHKEQMKYIK